MQQGDTVNFRVESEVETANCPDCQFPSRRVHSYYLRTLRDLPIGESRVVAHIVNAGIGMAHPHISCR